jgi:hypothetical protein
MIKFKILAAFSWKTRMEKFEAVEEEVFIPSLHTSTDWSQSYTGQCCQLEKNVGCETNTAAATNSVAKFVPRMC